MVSLPDVVAFELMSCGGDLWTSVTFDQRHERWIVYTNLRSELATAPDDAFRASETILRAVLHRRFARGDWVAAVLSGDRLSRTIRPTAAAAKVSHNINAVHTSAP